MESERYLSGLIPDGETFDEWVSRIVSFRIDLWGMSDQDWTKLWKAHQKLEKEIGEDPSTFEFVNLYTYSMTKSDSTVIKILIMDAGLNKYMAFINSGDTSITWTNITELSSDGTKAIPFIVSTTEPSSTNVAWIDTSELESSENITLRYYNGTQWVSYRSTTVLEKEVYDTENRQENVYKFADDIVDELEEDFSEFISHINNEYLYIHLDPDVREHFNSAIVTSAEFAATIAEGGTVYNSLMTFINNELDETLTLSDSEEEYQRIVDKFNEHLENHITEDDIDYWESKADGDHIHNNDGSVKISSDKIIEVFKFDDYVYKLFNLEENEPKCIGYGNDKFIILGYNSDSLWYSHDGLNFKVVLNN